MTSIAAQELSTAMDYLSTPMKTQEKAGQRVPENLRELADAGNPGRVLVE